MVVGVGGSPVLSSSRENSTKGKGLEIRCADFCQQSRATWMDAPAM